MMRARFLLMLCLTVLGGAWAPNAFAWWNNDWAFRKEISFDLTAQGADIAGAATDVPILVRLSMGNFQYFADAKPDGSDFVFIAADDKTPLKHHIERFDSQGQMAFVWVRVPRLTGGAKTDKLFLYYGNKEATAGGDAPGSFDKNQALLDRDFQPRVEAGEFEVLIGPSADRDTLISVRIHLDGVFDPSDPSFY